jgi:hypothetical protein
MRLCTRSTSAALFAVGLTLGLIAGRPTPRPPRPEPRADPPLAVEPLPGMYMPSSPGALLRPVACAVGEEARHLADRRSDAAIVTIPFHVNDVPVTLAYEVVEVAGDN